MTLESDSYYNSIFADSDDDNLQDSSDTKPTDNLQPEDNAEAVETPEPRKRRAVDPNRPPPIKMDAHRVCGERGVSEFCRQMSHTKFRGEGHERHNLRVLMACMQHWSHRLCPSLTFDECLARLERVGRTKHVQNRMKRMRLGVFDSESDTVTGASNHSADNVRRGDDDNDPFDEMLGRTGTDIYDEEHQVPRDVEEDLSQTNQQQLSSLQLEQINRNRERAQLLRMRNKRLKTSSIPSQLELSDPSGAIDDCNADTSDPHLNTDDDEVSPHIHHDTLPTVDTNSVSELSIGDI